MSQSALLFIAMVLSVLSGILGYVYYTSKDAFFFGATIISILYSIGCWILASAMLVAEENLKNLKSP